MRIVVALGGNALQRRGEPMTVEGQRANVATACRSLAPVAVEHELVVTHGNGPQVGLLALQAAAYDDVSSYPFDVLGAQTEGMIGYLIEQELGNLLPFEKPLATVLTMTEVDPADPAFADPTKFVGPVYTEADAQRLATEKGWTVRQDGTALASGRAVPGAAAHLRDPSGPLAARPGLRGHLRRRRWHPHDVQRRDAHPGRRRGRHRQGLGHRRARRGAGRRPSRHRDRRRRRVPRLGHAAAGRASPRPARTPCTRTTSRPAPWARRWRPRRASPAATGRPAVIGALTELTGMLDGSAGTRVDAAIDGLVRR